MEIDPHLHEWTHLVLRWAHILAAIMWIGDSFLFMWLDRALTPPQPAREGMTGETFMLHGGGYYHVEKHVLAPGKLPPVLHWFKWESISTWATGLLLLLVVYYVSGGAVLIDTSTSKLSVPVAMAVGLGILPVSWLIYDGLWKSPLGKSTAVAGAISLVLMAGLAFLLTRVFIGRAAYIHFGAALATLMFLNVWVRILPPQRRMLAAAKRGEAVDTTPGLAAKKRSTHNTYMTLPVLFVMVSNHFPTTYGSRYAWIALVVMSLAGAAVRHFMLVRTKRVAWLAVAAAAALVVAYILTKKG